MIRRARIILLRHEPILARTLSDSLMAAWLAGGQQAVETLPSLDSPSKTPPPGMPPPSPGNLIPEGEGEPVVRFPIIEEAAYDLAERQVMRKQDFDSLGTAAKREAFSVARVASLDALAKIQRAVYEDVRDGGTLREFVGKVDEAMDGSALSRAHIENVYRTNVATAYTQGLFEVLNHPLVSDEFPYLEYTAVHDSRTRHNHREMESLGLNGTSVYRRDDPVWLKFLPPWDYQCRCGVVPLTIEDAAARGVREAREWLRTGIPPSSPEHVKQPPFQPPAGFAGPDSQVVRLGVMG